MKQFLYGCLNLALVIFSNSIYLIRGFSFDSKIRYFHESFTARTILNSKMTKVNFPRRIQSKTKALDQSPFYVVNEVTLTGQKPSLKFCQPLELFTQFEKGLDLLMLKIWGLQIKGLQSYQPSNFVLAHSSAFTANECAIPFGPDSSAPGSNHSQSLMTSNFAVL